LWLSCPVSGGGVGGKWASHSSTTKGHIVIGAIILGIIAGYLARLLMPGKQDIGFILTAVLGIVGALVGFFIFTEVLGIGDNEAFDLGGLPGAVIGALLVLFLYERFAGGGRRPAAVR
jgi:uncharacterized membrane protein YeaQ/YmgE (transglycosylase-associated protein family)